MSPFFKTPTYEGWGFCVRPLRGQKVCMGPTWGPRTKKQRKMCFLKLVRRGESENWSCAPFDEKKLQNIITTKWPK